MASYQSSFDPPNHPPGGSRSRRQGTYLPPSEWISRPGAATRMDYRSPDNGSASGQVQGSRLPSKTPSNQMNLPKPSTRGPSPVPDNPVRNNPQYSTHGPWRPVIQPSSTPEAPVLKEKRSRNILRRKRSSIANDTKTLEVGVSQGDPNSQIQWPIASPTETSGRQIMYQDIEKREEYLATSPPRVTEVTRPVIPELDRYRSGTTQARSNYTKIATEVPHRIATHDLPPPTPLSSGLSSQSYYSGYSAQSGYSASPSTRYSESPGPGAYSRDTTPTSMSSQSPGIVAQVRMNPRLRQPSPISTRPPVTRRRMGSTPDEKDIEVLDTQGLPVLRESLTSSSSNSTVKGSEKSDQKAKEKKKKKRLSPLPPSPPPRKSSQKFKVNPLVAETSPSKSSKSPAKSIATTTTEASPSKQRTAPSPSSTSENNVPRRPRRPSRENTPDLQSQLGEPVAIIQSNLPAIQFSSNKRLSSSALPRPSDPATHRVEVTRPEMQSRGLPRNYSPAPAQHVQREPTPAPAGLGIIPDLRSTERLEYSRRTPSPGLRTPSPSATTSKSRFGLFGRRTKTTPELSTEQKAKPARKGPAAGTGHEGYGKYGPRSRGVGAGRGNTSSPSQDSIGSSPGRDQFIQERMSPRVIMGGGFVDSSKSSLDLTRSESSQSLPVRPSIESKASGSSKETGAGLWPSPLPRNQAFNRSSVSLGSKGTAGSGSTDNEFFVPAPSLAVRRSIHRLGSNDIEGLPLPRPLNVHPGSESLSSLDTSLMSDDARHDGARSAPIHKSGTRKLSKRPRSPRKWNFFGQRPPAAPSPKPMEAIVPVAIAPAPEKPVAYYTMMDSSGQEEEEAMDIEDILREAEVVDLSKLQTDSKGSLVQPANSPQRDVEKNVPVDAPPLLSRDEPQDLSPSPDALPIQVPEASSETVPINEQAAGRPSRLPQVGRIPRVVTARPEQTSPKSFSRPFARFSMSQPQQFTVVDRDSIAIGPSPNTSPNRGEKTDVPKSTAQEAPSSQPKDFLAIFARKDSGATNSSSSGGLSFSGITAVIPEPDSALEEDEVWDEYDDLIGNEEGSKVPPSATSSHGNPFQYENLETRAVNKTEEPPKESPTIDVAPMLRRTGIERLRLALATSSVYGPDVSARFKDTFNRPSPTTPMSFSDFISGYGDRNNSVVTGSGGTRRASSAHSPRDTRPASSHSKSASVGETPRQSGESKLMTISEQVQESPTAQMNLRVGSMTVSKWLTFGHVLFSPVRNEFSEIEEGSKPHSVLVIDGLGNDDWSFYAAETYPAVTFYNLSPTPSRDPSPTPAHNTSTSTTTSSSLSLPQLPPNHRQIQYTTYTDKFPFPRDNFSAVVLRFLPAVPETALRNLIAESKRVLKPAGYLEMSILDLDMMNMGNRARRAVRGLKVQISVATPDVSLASASDTVLRIVGRRGFVDVKSCRVGVPVASTVPSSSSTTGSGSGSGSSAPSTGPFQRSQAQAQGQAQAHGQPAPLTTIQPLTYQPPKEEQQEQDIPLDERSLADMMRDSTPASDAGITKMVAKVGRWWYMRCYEMGVLPAGGDAAARSLFADEALLRECEKWNTSFKLLVCHAQKPGLPGGLGGGGVGGRRRGASV